jgi:hypothetical protein
MPTRYLLVPAAPAFDGRSAVPFGSYIEAIAHLNTDWPGWYFSGPWRTPARVAGELADVPGDGVARVVGVRDGERRAVLLALAPLASSGLEVATAAAPDAAVH